MPDIEEKTVLHLCGARQSGKLIKQLKLLIAQGCTKIIVEESNLRPQRDKLLDACQKGRLLSNGWREVIAELDDMPKSEALAKAMWACLNQIDRWRKEAKAAIAEAEPKVAEAERPPGKEAEDGGISDAE